MPIANNRQSPIERLQVTRYKVRYVVRGASFTWYMQRLTFNRATTSTATPTFIDKVKYNREN